MLIRALSIKQPWAWAIMHGKDIENRDWATGFRGRFAVHASAGLTKREYEEASWWIFDRIGADVPPMDELVRGAVLGAVELTGCVKRSDSDWFVGTYGFEVRDPKLLATPIPAKGKLNFWSFDMPEDEK